MRRKILTLFLALAMLVPFVVPGIGAATNVVSAQGDSSFAPLPVVEPESFALHKSTVVLNMGKTATFSIVSVVPENTTLPLDGVWTSSNPAVVAITGKAAGQIRAVGYGVAVITCDVNGVTASSTVVVPQLDRSVESFQLHKSTLKLLKGKTATLNIANVLPVDATNVSAAKWFTSNSSIVEFTGNAPGQIRALRAGTVNITCQIGAVKAYCKVTVENPAPTPTPAAEAKFVKVSPAMLDQMREEYISDKMKLFDEYESILTNPPLSANPYLPPINSALPANANTWRSPGAYWDEPHTTAKIDMYREWELHNIFLYDGPVYNPSTYTADGSAPYEVMGGTFKVYAGTTLLLSYDLTNAGVWVNFDLTELIGDKGVTTRQLTFVKEQDTSMDGGFRYTWSGGGWTSEFGQYICDVNIVEVALYGIPLGDDPVIEDDWSLKEDGRPVTDFGFTMGEFIGTNSFYNENMNTYEAIGFIREYHNWGWTEYAANDRPSAGVYNDSGMTMNPDVAFFDGGNGDPVWGFDNYYKQLKEKGIGVSICVQRGVSGSPHERPDYQGDDPKSAASYLAHGQSMFQLAARYGSNKNIDPALVKVAGGTPKEIGLGYVEYFENWNEPNLGAFTGAQFAAMTSADYDGHMGTMGSNVGVKNADPNAKLVLGGLAGMVLYEKMYWQGEYNCTEFVEDMMKWFDQNRTEEQWKAAHDGSLEGYVRYPFDVLNGHYYCPDACIPDGMDSQNPTGLSPEADYLYERISEFVSFRDKYLPDKEIWLSEFGWDTTQGSPNSATVEYVKNGVTYNEGINVGLDGEEVQGRWIVREFLMLAAAGIDRAQQFMMPNSGSGDGSTGRFETCGMLNGFQGSDAKKPSWYYVGTMRFLLEDTVFGAIIEKGGDDGLTGPWVLRFDETKSDDNVFALWLPTSLGDMDGANVVDYSLSLPDGAEFAYMIELVDDVQWGEMTELAVTDGVAVVPVTEKPVFVLVSAEEYYKPVPEILNSLNFAADNLTAPARGDIAGDPNLLFDEHCTSLASVPSTEWGHQWWVSSQSRDEGLYKYAIIDLGAKYTLSEIFLWDVGCGIVDGNAFAIYAGELGDWTPNLGAETKDSVLAQLAGDNWTRVAEYNFRKAFLWESLPVDVTARYLIVGYEGENTQELGDPHWLFPTFELTEMMLKGHIAKGETPPPPPPPFVRTFEEKPSSDEYDFLFDENFDDKSGTGYTVAPYGDATLVAGVNADGTDGKVLRVTRTQEQGITINPAVLTDLEYDTWYNLDFKFYVDGAVARPRVALLDAWLFLINYGGAADTFKPIWGGGNEERIVTSNEWHRLNTRFMVDGATNCVSYEIYYDDTLLGAAATNMTLTLPISAFNIYMNVAEGASANVSYDDVWLYTEKVSTPTPTPEPTPTAEPTPTPEPGEYIFDGSFDQVSLGRLTSGGGLVALDANDSEYLANVIQPVSGDVAYRGDGNQVLKVEQVSAGGDPHNAFDLGNGDFLSQIERNQDYIVEFSFLREVGSTVTASFELATNGWKRYKLMGTDWASGNLIYDNAGWVSPYYWTPVAGEWHRVVMKFRYNDAGEMVYSFYVNDMTTPVKAGTARAGDVPANEDWNIPDNNDYFGSAFRFGVINAPGTVYYDDVLVYAGTEIK